MKTLLDGNKHEKKGYIEGVHREAPGTGGRKTE